MNKAVLIAVVSAFLAGCSSLPMTLQEYWFGQGERFGSAGMSIDNYVLEQMKQQRPFDEASYIQGYQKGKLSYCDPYKAFEKGIQGKRYDEQCVEMPQEVMIKAEWQRGYDAFMNLDRRWR